MKNNMFLKKILNWGKAQCDLIGALWAEYRILRRNSGLIRPDADPVKLRSAITVQAHTIEKGLSLAAPRPLFGLPKIMLLLNNLDRFHRRFGEPDFVLEKLSIVRTYLEFNHEREDQVRAVIDKAEALLKKMNCTWADASHSAGVYHIKDEEIRRQAELPFPEFVFSRHSYRYFDHESKLDKAKVLAALKLAERTPLSCNRQAQKVYLIDGGEKSVLCQTQGGANGFGDEFDLIILLTGDERWYFRDIHQVYVDCGMYAMTLLYALHSQGVATIPLSLGNKALSGRREFCRRFEIPATETPIMLIGCGVPPREGRVNVSSRSDFVKYTQDRTGGKDGAK